MVILMPKTNTNMLRITTMNLNELINHISNHGEELVVSSEIVAKGFNVEHDSLAKSLSRRITDLKSVLVSGTQNGRPRRIFLLTERQIALIPAIVRTTEETWVFQKALVDAFMEARKQLQGARILDRIPTQKEALQGWLAAVEVLEVLQKKIEDDRPKIEAAENLLLSKDCQKIEGFAKVLGTTRNELFAWLRERGFCFKRPGKDEHNHVTAQYIRNGWFVERMETWQDPSGITRNYPQIRITPKGAVCIEAEWRSFHQAKLTEDY